MAHQSARRGTTTRTIAWSASRSSGRPADASPTSASTPNAASPCFASSMSVHVPNQRTTRPAPSRSGTARARNQRKPPEARSRNRYSISYGAPVASDALQTAWERSKSSGCRNSFQFQPCATSPSPPGSPGRGMPV